MSEFQFGDPPKNGKQVKVTGGHPAPTPYHVEVWVDGKLQGTRKFGSEAEARDSNVRKLSADAPRSQRREAPRRRDRQCGPCHADRDGGG